MKAKASFVCGSQTPNGLGGQHNLFGILVHKCQPQPARSLLLVFFYVQDCLAKFRLEKQSIIPRAAA